jgi:hypothetical protein
MKCVMVVSYEVLSHKETFQRFESESQDIKSAMLLCKPPLLAFASKESLTSLAQSIFDASPVKVGDYFLDLSSVGVEDAHQFVQHAKKLQRRRSPLLCLCKILCCPCFAISSCVDVYHARRS